MKIYPTFIMTGDRNKKRELSAQRTTCFCLQMEASLDGSN